MLGTGQVTGGNNSCIAICGGCFYRHYQTGYTKHTVQKVPRIRPPGNSLCRNNLYDLISGKILVFSFVKDNTGTET